MITLAQKTRTRKRDGSKKPNPQQLNLLTSQPTESVNQARTLKPAISTQLALVSWHRSKWDRYWLRCNHIKKQLGKLFYRAKADCILACFKGRAELIKLHEFGVVAKRAVTRRTDRGAA